MMLALNQEWLDFNHSFLQLVSFVCFANMTRYKLKQKKTETSEWKKRSEIK